MKQLVIVALLYLGYLAGLDLGLYRLIQFDDVELTDQRVVVGMCSPSALGCAFLRSGIAYIYAPSFYVQLHEKIHLVLGADELPAYALPLALYLVLSVPFIWACTEGFK